MKKIISLVLVIALMGVGYLFFQTLSPNPSPLERGTSALPPLSIGKRPGERVSRVKIVAIGDSLTAGYGLNLDESYPNQLEEKLQENNFNVQIINAGVSGETTAGLLERIDFIKKQKPELVLITIGGNDALRALPVEETEKNISEIVKSLKETLNSDKIFLMRIQAPANLGFTYTRQFNAVYQKIASQENINLVEFVVPEVFTNSDFMQNDGIHPNKDGYQVLVDKYIYPKVVKVLK